MSSRDEAGSPNRREEGTPRRMPRSSERGGSHFEAACEIGRARKKEKMEGNAKKSVSELLEKMGVEYRELKFEDGVVGWVILTGTESPDWINTVFTIGEVIS